MAYGPWGLPNKGVSPTLASKAGIKGWEITSANPLTISPLTMKGVCFSAVPWLWFSISNSKKKRKDPDLLTFVRQHLLQIEFKMKNSSRKILTGPNILVLRSFFQVL